MMTKRDELIALAERVEALEEPFEYGAVAKDIYRVRFGAPTLGRPGGYGWREDASGWWLATGEDARMPPKTIYPPNWLTSLDAAIMLYPVLPDTIPSCPRKATAAALRALAAMETTDDQ